MTAPFQRRRLMLLSGATSSEEEEVLTILKGPLDLARLLVCSGFSQNGSALRGLKDQIDGIKKIVAGLNRAQSLAADYSVADYASYLFAFQQFFNSSYRARQGGVLEAAIRQVLLDSGAVAYRKKEHKTTLVSALGIETRRGHDVDVLASKDSTFLLMQVRSRDDTGGTTAKGSLAELLREILQAGKVTKDVLYLILVWEGLERAQRQALIRKVVSQIEKDVDRGMVDPDNLEELVATGDPVKIHPKVSLQVAYGLNEFATILSSFTARADIGTLLENVLDRLNDWDDLWLSYAILSLELERLVIGKQSNLMLLEKKLSELGIVLGPDDLADYERKSEEYSLELMGNWKETTLPVSSPSDTANYIRDLVLLRMVYQEVQGECERLVGYLQEGTGASQELENWSKPA